MEQGDMILNLLDSVRLPEENSCWVDSWWQAEVAEIITALSSSEIKNDLLYEFQMDVLGRKLVFVLQVLSRFANKLINGPYIDEHTDQVLSQLVEEDDGSLLDYIETRSTALRSIAQHLASASADCTRVWEETQNTDAPSILPDLIWPLRNQNHPPAPSSVDLHNSESVMNSANFGDANAMESDIIDSPSQDWHGNDAAEVPSLGDLKSRGKGKYSCPQGINCKKGGVEGGKVKVFTRNSEFRAHLLKHEKMYKCDLAGCPNKKGFSRLDQLERHKRLVKHEQSVWREENPGQGS
ncbi:uncharacterized protein LY89DRAFT_728809 [Mollisia scopiformis]|uniref:C2H2-type domain-containing protein n=1 Tax=Mollisia scopiformis TaxID=149040 RepID=A0A194XQX5_MOLSC|nr:uncharacterized protein LY89DRAFT_728809 [Mollisia scopiformis]KUJ22690.1 hypothetical protein LY89DRAFT_728809 [Mollisia scopiformis]